MPGRQLGDRVGRGRGDEEGVAVGDQLEVADRVVLGLRIAGEGAAHRVALELRDQDRRADDALEGGGADEAGGRLGHQHPHPVAGDGSEPGELQRLVGGDPTADAEQDPGHLSSSAAAGRLGAVLVFELALGKLFKRHREVVRSPWVSTIGGGYSPKPPSPRLWK